MATVYCNIGKDWTTGKAIGTYVTSPNRIGWGTGAGTAAIADTTLFTEAAETRATGTMTQQTTTTSNDTMQVVGTITSLSGQTITNAGVLDAAAAGKLIVHADHTGLPLLANDSIQYTFGLRQS